MIEKSRLYCLGYCHFAFSIVTGASSFYLDARESRTLIFMSSVPLAFTYSVFFMWILTALKDTKERLRLSRQTVKLTMYENMTRSLFYVFAITSAVVSLMSISIYVKTGSLDWYQRHWVSSKIHHDDYQI